MRKSKDPDPDPDPDPGPLTNGSGSGRPKYMRMKYKVLWAALCVPDEVDSSVGAEVRAGEEEWAPHGGPHPVAEVGGGGDQVRQELSRLLHQRPGVQHRAPATLHSSHAKDE
jgi:hypothetical protein